MVHQLQEFVHKITEGLDPDLQMQEFSEFLTDMAVMAGLSKVNKFHKMHLDLFGMFEIEISNYALTDGVVQFQEQLYIKYGDTDYQAQAFLTKFGITDMASLFVIGQNPRMVDPDIGFGFNRDTRRMKVGDLFSQILRPLASSSYFFDNTLLNQGNFNLAITNMVINDLDATQLNMLSQLCVNILTSNIEIYQQISTNDLIILNRINLRTQDLQNIARRFYQMVKLLRIVSVNQITDLEALELNNLIHVLSKGTDSDLIDRNRLVESLQIAIPKVQNMVASAASMNFNRLSQLMEDFNDLNNIILYFGRSGTGSDFDIMTPLKAWEIKAIEVRSPRTGTFIEIWDKIEIKVKDYCWVSDSSVDNKIINMEEAGHPYQGDMELVFDLWKAEDGALNILLERNRQGEYVNIGLLIVNIGNILIDHYYDGGIELRFDVRVTFPNGYTFIIPKEMVNNGGEISISTIQPY